MIVKLFLESFHSNWNQRVNAIVRDTEFRRLLLANFLWWFTRFAHLLISGWVAFTVTNSPFHVVLLTFYQSLALPVMGMFSGTLIGRIGSRKIVLVTQIVYTIVYLGTTALILTGFIAFWHLAVGGLLTGMCWGISWPARRSILVNIVGENKISDAVVIDYSAQTIAGVLGAAATGLITRFLGEAWSYGLIAALSCFAVIVLRALPDYRGRPNVSKATIRSETKIHGIWRYISSNQAVLGVLLLSMAMNFLVFPTRGLLPVFASTILKGDALQLGLLGSAQAFGSLIGLGLVYLGLTVLRNTHLFVAGALLQSAALVWFAMSTSFVISMFTLVVAGVGQACFSIMQSEIVLTSTDKNLRNSVLGWIVLSIGVGGPLGKLNLGGVTRMIGPKFALGGAAAASFCIIVLIVLCLPGFWRPRVEFSDTVKSSRGLE